jgi:hypothetical protein
MGHFLLLAPLEDQDSWMVGKAVSCRIEALQKGSLSHPAQINGLRLRGRHENLWKTVFS